MKNSLTKSANHEHTLRSVIPFYWNDQGKALIDGKLDDNVKANRTDSNTKITGTKD